MISVCKNCSTPISFEGTTIAPDAKEWVHVSSDAPRVYCSYTPDSLKAEPTDDGKRPDKPQAWLVWEVKNGHTYLRSVTTDEALAHRHMRVCQAEHRMGEVAQFYIEPTRINHLYGAKGL